MISDLINLSSQFLYEWKLICDVWARKCSENIFPFIKICNVKQQIQQSLTHIYARHDSFHVGLVNLCLFTISFVRRMNEKRKFHRFLQLYRSSLSRLNDLLRVLFLACYRDAPLSPSCSYGRPCLQTLVKHSKVIIEE